MHWCLDLWKSCMLPPVFFVLINDLFEGAQVDVRWSQVCHSAVVASCGRRIAPHLKQLMPAWLQAQHDEHAPAQSLAHASLTVCLVYRLYCTTKKMYRLVWRVPSPGVRLIPQLVWLWRITRWQMAQPLMYRAIWRLAHSTTRCATCDATSPARTCANDNVDGSKRDTLPSTLSFANGLFWN